MINDYYRLTKPGIVYGNVFTTIAAFLFASRWHLDSSAALDLFTATVVGIALVIASACVFNNYLDRHIDAKMERTKNRPLVTGAISIGSALSFGAVLIILGLALLYLYVNALTAGIALFGFFSYVVLYGWAKRASSWGAVVGSIPGAVPIVVGYTAVTGRIDAAAIILFFILVLWQMPHFYAIAMQRFDDYAAAGIPTLPATRGMRVAKVHIILYIVAYLIAALLLTAFGYAGYAYAASVAIFGVAWLYKALKGFRASSGNGNDSGNAPDAAAAKAADVRWARGVFRFSLIVLITFSVALAVAPLLP